MICGCAKAQNLQNIALREIFIRFLKIFVLFILQLMTELLPPSVKVMSL